MNPPPQFYTLPTLRRAPGQADFEALLDLLPVPALLLDARSKRVVLANARATELTAYTRAELAGMDFERLSANPTSQAALQKSTTEADTLPLALLKRNKSQVEIVASFQKLSSQSRWILASLEPAEQVQRRMMESTRRGEVIDSMKMISAAIHQPHLNSAAQDMVEAARQMTKADTAALYLQELAGTGQEILMPRLIVSGAAGVLPDALPAQDMAHLRRPLIWTPGKRIASSLHLAARSNSLAYLASAPLGSSSAAIGVLALAGSATPSLELLLVQVEILADATSALIEHHSRATSLEADLLELKRTAAIRALVENTIDEAVIVLSPELDSHAYEPGSRSNPGVLVWGSRGAARRSHPHRHRIPDPHA